MHHNQCELAFEPIYHKWSIRCPDCGHYIEGTDLFEVVTGWLNHLRQALTTASDGRVGW